ncbi:unnamed protein product [Paramecium primaurelia]|uniref:Uncharacterized protein n=1 Tax=Paramecium primaurelia TaxID=5886 RepID=A0A8S1MC58_PARPR|nr:unnamed protein product [Paramecium primaurelia]
MKTNQQLMILNKNNFIKLFQKYIQINYDLFIKNLLFKRIKNLLEYLQNQKRFYNVMLIKVNIQQLNKWIMRVNKQQSKKFNRNNGKED